MHVDTEAVVVEEPMQVDAEMSFAELLVTGVPSAKVEHTVLLHAKLQK